MDTTDFPPRIERHARIIRARFALKSGLGGDMLIQNISDWGIGARCTSPHIFPGDAIDIDLPLLGTVAAVVRWVHDGRIGVRFVEAVDVNRLRFHTKGTLLCSPEKFSVAHQFEPDVRTYRPGLRSR